MNQDIPEKEEMLQVPLVHFRAFLSVWGLGTSAWPACKAMPRSALSMGMMFLLPTIPRRKYLSLSGAVPRERVSQLVEH